VRSAPLAIVLVSLSVVALPHGQSSPAPNGGTSVEQTAPGPRPALVPLVSFDGLGVGMTPGPGTNNPPAPRNPSDNTLAVGRDHVVQIVNSQMAIFSKQGKTLFGPVSTNAMFAGFGGVCEARPNGDAVVRYDQLADRWLVVMPIFRRVVFGADRSKPGDPARPGEAARAGTGRPGAPPPLPAPTPGQPPALPPPDGTYAICYALSAGPDPLGPYHRYVFERPLFPDYPRPAIWPDGYYVPTSTGDEVIQKHACVVERAKMLTGEPAHEQCLIVDGVNFLNNADIDGTGLPPRGAPNVMIAAGGTQLKNVYEDDGLFVWKFHVDWDTPSNTKLDGPVKLPVAPYHYLCNGQLSNCVSQPGTDRKLDSQGDKIMQRLVYRNVDGRESIVAVHSVDTAAGGGGVRWYELRIDGRRNVAVHQQGTFAPDGFYRWMASPAIDRQGNIAIGYSFGGAPNFPGQRFAARLAGDPLGQMTFREAVLVDGEAAQTVMRWQDYTQTAMDPSDDCTIWYAGDYVKKDASTYSTKIGAFRLPGCAASSTQKEALTMTRASGTFDVKITPQTESDPAIARMLIDKQYHGDIEGTGKGQMLAAGAADTKDSGVYVAIEKVTGTVHGKTGTFMLKHGGVMHRGAQHLEITIVPDSGTGELAGISGRCDIKIEGGKHFYELDYVLAPAK
jgi:hypothetical protein